MDEITDAEVDELAQIIRGAHVTTLIGRSSGFAMTPWKSLVSREQAPYLASAVAVFQHLNSSPKQEVDHRIVTQSS